MSDLIGKVLAERDAYYRRRTIRVIGVSQKQTSAVGAVVKSTVYDAEVLTDAFGHKPFAPRTTRIQEHILRAKWSEVQS